MSIWIYPIDMILSQIRNAAKHGIHLYRRMYGVQGVILDDRYSMVSRVKNIANTTPIVFEYNANNLGLVIA
ncbi:hypothetical protein PG357_06585 [Riemerella anatipestifer]|nr:hypothetical protein [Riemerella anatipestifer]